MNKFMDIKKIVLWVGRFEGVSLLVLFFIAMPLKYLAGEPQAVRMVGSIHGFLFLAYMVAAFSLMEKEGWSMRTLVWCLVLSSLPFGTFYFEKKYLKSASK